MAKQPKIEICGLEDVQLLTYMQRFLTSRRARGVQPGTIHFYEVNLLRYLQWLAHHPALVWDSADTIDLYLAAERARGLKDNTIHARYKTLSVWFGWLLKRKLIVESPIAMIDAPEVKQAPIQYMTLVEYQQLTGSITGNAWIDKRDRVLLYILFWCGLRIAEACALRQNDIDMAAKVVKVQRGKGGDGRYVPCGDDLFPLVLDYLYHRPTSNLDWLFVGTSGGGGVRGQFTPGGARTMMKRRCQWAGMRHISPHKGRHGLAMEMLNAGLEMSAVSKVLGHANQKTTSDKYAKWLTRPLVRKYTQVREQLLTDLVQNEAGRDT